MRPDGIAEEDAGAVPFKRKAEGFRLRKAALADVTRDCKGRRRDDGAVGRLGQSLSAQRDRDRTSSDLFEETLIDRS
jgi:hypothetical protein